MNLEVLIATMNLKDEQENLDLIKAMHIQGNSLTINQMVKEEIQSTNQLEKRNRIISVHEKGLSKSRNLAIEKTKAEIGVLADDDVVYQKNYQRIIEESYRKNPKMDLLCFFVESKNPKRKVKRMITSRLGKIRSLRVCSFQITFKVDCVREKRIKFDENFGAGAYYDRGEENIFLQECIKRRIKNQVYQ